MARTKSCNKRKKNSGRARAQRAAPWALKHYGVLFLSGWDCCRIIDFRNGKAINATEDFDLTMKNLRHNWNTALAVFHEDADGKPDLDLTEAFFPKSYRIDIVDQQTEKHQALMDASNEDTCIGFGWIASPYGWEIDRESARHIFKLHGAWDNRQWIKKLEQLESSQLSASSTGQTYPGTSYTTTSTGFTTPFE